MLKLSKKADYALIAVRHLATHRGEPSQSASDIAEAYGISAPLLAKVLQRLAKHGFEHRVSELNWAAAQLAKDAAKGRDAYVAGSVGPLGIGTSAC